MSNLNLAGICHVNSRKTEDQSSLKIQTGQFSLLLTLTVRTASAKTVHVLREFLVPFSDYLFIIICIETSNFWQYFSQRLVLFKSITIFKNRAILGFMIDPILNHWYRRVNSVIRTPLKWVDYPHLTTINYP